MISNIFCLCLISLIASACECGHGFYSHSKQTAEKLINLQSRPAGKSHPTHGCEISSDNFRCSFVPRNKYTVGLMGVLLAWLYLHREDDSHGKYGLGAVTSCGVFITIWSPQTLCSGVDSFANNSADKNL